MALYTPAFWLIGVSFLLSMFGTTGVAQNQVPHLNDIGFPLSLAASALSIVALGSAIGKLVFGWLCDRLMPKYVWCLNLCLQLISIIIFISIKPTSPPAALWLYAIIIGISGGGWLPPMSMVVSSTFGLASYGTIFGAINLFHAVGTATGPLAAGYIYDIMNTYYWFFIITLALIVVSILTIVAVRRHT